MRYACAPAASSARTATSTPSICTTSGRPAGRGIGARERPAGPALGNRRGDLAAIAPSLHCARTDIRRQGAVQPPGASPVYAAVVRSPAAARGLGIGAGRDARVAPAFAAERDERGARRRTRVHAANSAGSTVSAPPRWRCRPISAEVPADADRAGPELGPSARRRRARCARARSGCRSASTGVSRTSIQLTSPPYSQVAAKRARRIARGDRAARRCPPAGSARRAGGRR